MKRTNILLFVTVALVTLASCFKDKGNYDYVPVNRFEVQMTPEVLSDDQTFWVIQPTDHDDSVVFHVRVAQTLATDSTNLDLRWFVWANGASVADTVRGFSCPFHFPEGEETTYEVSFFADDETTGLSYRDDFKVKTRQPFHYSWVILHNDGSESRLGFLDMPASAYRDSATVVLDGYETLMHMRRFKDAEFVAYTPQTLSGDDDRLWVLSPDSAVVLQPYSLEVAVEQEEVYAGQQPVDFRLVRSYPGTAQAGGYGRVLLVSESGEYFFSDLWGHIYAVDLDASVPADYTATDAYPVPGTGFGYNLVWDGEYHRFYYQVQPSSPTWEGYLSEASRASAVLKDVSEGGELPLTETELEGLDLVWLGKGVKNNVGNRTGTASALLRGEDGAFRMINFAFAGKDDGGDEIVMEEMDIDFGNYEVDETSCFAATNAFAAYLFFSSGTGIYRMDLGGDDGYDIEQIATVDGEIVQMDFRMVWEGDESLPSYEGAFDRILAVAYDTPDGGGGVTEIYLSNGGDLESTTSYTGFDHIIDMVYMPRITRVGY